MYVFCLLVQEKYNKIQDWFKIDLKTQQKCDEKMIKYAA